MTFDFLLDFRALDTEAEIFWDLPLDADPSCKYLIFIEEKQVGETNKTHFSLNNLSPDSSYDVEVKMQKNPGDFAVSL